MNVQRRVGTLDAAGDVDAFLENASSSAGSKDSSGSQLLESLESELEGYEKQLRELNSYSEKLTSEYNEKVELQEVLELVLRALQVFLGGGLGGPAGAVFWG